MIEHLVTNVLLIYELLRVLVSNIFNFDMVENKEILDGRRPGYRGRIKGDTER
ncbi:hypothetical protein B4114_2945 [Geobacillus stearothermophilus]|uniref:Uncharacterized protein n=1 Tax=Geobacillus stearothermophilus TaxID=1422 RepID=A0A150N256_GEOSE|nr:hypothetical protein B4114_2945 [Geobacillus stearothermophilus]